MRAHRGVCVRRCVCLQGCVCDCVCECMRVCELLQASKHYSNCVTFDSTETKALQHDLQAALQAHTHTHTHVECAQTPLWAYGSASDRGPAVHGTQGRPRRPQVPCDCCAAADPLPLSRYADASNELGLVVVVLAVLGGGGGTFIHTWNKTKHSQTQG